MCILTAWLIHQRKNCEFIAKFFELMPQICQAFGAKAGLEK